MLYTQGMRIFLTLIFLITAGCAAPQAFVDGDQAPMAFKKKFKTAKSPSECLKLKGSWYAVKRPEVFPNGGYCQFRTKDAGKSCQSSRECSGYCELSFDAEAQGAGRGIGLARCSTFAPPRWDRCVPGYFEKGKILGRGECFGDDAEVQ